MSLTRSELNLKLESMGFSIDCKFVPFSQSRNAKEKHKSVNWKVTLKYNNKIVVTNLDYMQGIGYLPKYLQPHNGILTIHRAEYLNHAVEYGKIVPENSILMIGKPIPTPSIADVVACILLDSQAMDCRNFQEWADECGYDSDSIKAKEIYDSCMQTALALRSTVGDKIIEELRCLFDNY